MRATSGLPGTAISPSWPRPSLTMAGKGAPHAFLHLAPGGLQGGTVHRHRGVGGDLVVTAIQPGQHLAAPDHLARLHR